MLYFQESVRMVVAVSIHFRAGCFSTCRVGMGHRSGLVGEGVAHIQVFIGGFNNRKLTGSTAAVARQCACTAYTIVDAVQLRVSRTVAQIVRIDGMTATSVHDLNYLNDVREDITTA